MDVDSSDGKYADEDFYEKQIIKIKMPNTLMMSSVDGKEDVDEIDGVDGEEDVDDDEGVDLR